MENENFKEDKFREILQKTVTTRVSSVGKDLMEFRSNFQQSAQAIIDNVSQILNTVEEELLQDLKDEVSHLESGLRGKVENEVREQLESEVRQKLDAEWEPRLVAAKEAGIQSAQGKLQTKLEILNNALHEISSISSQVEILTNYLDKASLFASRTALFVMKSGNLLGWQARGFEGEFNNASIKSVIFLPEHDNCLRRAAESRKPFRSETTGDRDILQLVSRFGPVAPETVCAIPLVVRDKAVAVLYADSGVANSNPIDENALQIITTVVSLTVELSSARMKLGVKPADAASTDHSVQEKGKEVSEKPMEAQPEAGKSIPHTAVQPPKEVPAPPPSVHSPSEYASLTQHIEELPKKPSSPITVEPAKEPAAMAGGEVHPEPLSHTPVSLEDLSEGEQKLHNDARRFARLLVSEIKLYNEQKVHAGRRDRNLYTLLRDDVDKSREMYDKRVSPEVAAKVDYFYEELVKILAENQVSALGTDCPGPVIMARQ